MWVIHTVTPGFHCVEHAAALDVLHADNMAFSAEFGVSPTPLDQASLRDAKTEPSILNEALTQLPPELPSVLRKLVKWGDFAAVGTPIHPTRFVPCKTPLSRQILENWTLPEPPVYPLTVPQLLEEQQALGRRVGLILDLSNVRLRHV